MQGPEEEAPEARPGGAKEMRLVAKGKSRKAA
jgi:hypothetical protein